MEHLAGRACRWVRAVFLQLWAVSAMTLLSSGGLAASSWVIDRDASRLEFSVEVGGNSLKGRFVTFDADIRFEPSDPEAGSLSVTVDVGSLTTGDAQSGLTARSSPWLAARDHRQACFVAKGFRPLGGGRYSAAGALTLKGVEVPVVLEFALAVEDGFARAQGTAVLDRVTFGVGPARSAATPVGHQVTVSFTIVARAGE